MKEQIRSKNGSKHDNDRSISTLALKRKPVEKKEKVEKDEEDDKVAKEEDDGESDMEGSEDNEKENAEEADIRDMRHKLEKLGFHFIWVILSHVLFPCVFSRNQREDKVPAFVSKSTQIIEIIKCYNHQLKGLFFAVLENFQEIAFGNIKKPRCQECYVGVRQGYWPKLDHHF